MHDNTAIKKERYIPVVVSENTQAGKVSLDELSRLLETAGAEALEYVIQKLPNVDPATYVGSGKAHELKEMVSDLGADGIICDDELSPAQMRNLSDILECKVLDRTMLILDIFAKHAKTGEGKV